MVCFPDLLVSFLCSCRRPSPRPEPVSGLPGVPAGPDTKGCAEEGFVRSHETVQPVSAELGVGSWAAAIAKHGEAGQPGAAAAGPRARREPPGAGSPAMQGYGEPGNGPRRGRQGWPK